MPLLNTRTAEPAPACVYLVCTRCTSSKHDQTPELIYSMAVVCKGKDSEMCSEVNHERFNTGSDTVIHSAQIKANLSLELPVLSATNYRDTAWH